MEKPSEHLLEQPIPTLGLSAEFNGITEILGFHTLDDLLRLHTREVVRLPGFNVNLIHEYVSFLEERDLGHLVDSV